MIDQSKNFDTSKEAESSMPSMLASMSNTKMDMTQYRVRVERFELDSDMTGQLALENLYSRGIDGSGEVVILKEKTFTDKDVMVVMVFYMEKRPSNDPSSILKKLRESE